MKRPYKKFQFNRKYKVHFSFSDFHHILGNFAIAALEPRDYHIEKLINVELLLFSCVAEWINQSKQTTGQLSPPSHPASIMPNRPALTHTIIPKYSKYLLTLEMTRMYGYDES